MVKNIPFFDYPALFKLKKNEILEVITDVLERGAYILQKDLFKFEENIKKFIGVKHAFGVADGTNALILALMAADVERDDEVIMCSHTYIATAASAHFVGAKPVLVECGQDHMIDVKDIERAITDKTKIIMPTQLNGRTCNMGKIQEIADKYNLLIIEDAAQALGSKYQDKFAGTFGIAGTFSFYPAKLLGCFGDGGMVVTNDDEIARKFSLLRDHGRDETGEVVAWGTNSRLDNLQAAVLNLKLSTYNDDILRRREIATFYHQALKEIFQVTLPPEPIEDGEHYDVYQNYEIEAEKRNSLKEFLSNKGIGTIIQWGGKAVHQCKGVGFNNIKLPKTEEMTSRFLMLPMHTALKNEDLEYVCDCIKQFYGES